MQEDKEALPDRSNMPKSYRRKQELRDKKKAHREAVKKGIYISGRPEQDIDWDRVDMFLIAGCNQERIAGACGLTKERFSDRFFQDRGMDYAEYAAKKKREGESLLEAAQFSKALKEKNTQMQIWLGKCKLGQKEMTNDVMVNEELAKAIVSNEALMAQIEIAQQAHKESQALNIEDMSNSDEANSD